MMVCEAASLCAVGASASNIPSAVVVVIRMIVSLWMAASRRKTTA